MRLPQRDAASNDDRAQGEHAGKTGDHMATHKTAESIAGAICTRFDRMIALPASDVVGECLDRGVAARGFVIARTRDNDAKITTQGFRRNRAGAVRIDLQTRLHQS